MQLSTVPELQLSPIPELQRSPVPEMQRSFVPEPQQSPVSAELQQSPVPAELQLSPVPDELQQSPVAVPKQPPVSLAPLAYLSVSRLTQPAQQPVPQLSTVPVDALLEPQPSAVSVNTLADL